MIEWLKRIFSISTLSLLIAILTLVITYISYKNNTSGNIEIKIRGKKIECNEDDKNDYIAQKFFDYNKKQDIVNLKNYPLPTFINNSSRTVKNLNFLVEVICNRTTVVPSKEFELIEKEANVFKYKYKRDRLEPFEEIPFPFDTLKGIWTENLNTRQLLTPIEFNITYEGINRKKTINCTIIFEKQYFYIYKYLRILDQRAKNKVSKEEAMFLQEEAINYVKERNNYLDFISHLAESFKESNLIMTIGDTTIVHPRFDDYEGKSLIEINSLDELRPYKIKNWFLIICMIWIFGYTIYIVICIVIEYLNSRYDNIKEYFFEEIFDFDDIGCTGAIIYSILTIINIAVLLWYLYILFFDIETIYGPV